MFGKRSLSRVRLAHLALAASLLVCSSCGRRAQVRRAPMPSAPAARSEPAPVVGTGRPRADAPNLESLSPELARPAEARRPSPFPGVDPTSASWPDGHFEKGVYRNAAGLKLPYRVFMPAVCERPCPLVLYLHSTSGQGADNETQVNGSRRWGAGFWTSERVQSRHPAFVLIPQADPKLAPTWVRLWRKDPRDGPDRAEPLELAIELLERLQRRLPVDPARVYVTGFSMGGFGSWIAISRHPEKFAAAAPVAGGGDPAHVTGAKSAVWAFHGARDSIVPVSRTRTMVQALRKAGAKPRYTEYPGKGHFIIREALAEPELVDWLFAQRADWLR